MKQLDDWTDEDREAIRIIGKRVGVLFLVWLAWVIINELPPYIHAHWTGQP